MSIASVVGASPAAAAPAPEPSSHAGAGIRHSGVAPAKGTLRANIDLESIKATPTRGGTTCQLTDRTTLTLTGAVAGTVKGSTTADVQAPCNLATTTPPGAYPATFTLTGTFHGKVADLQAKGPVTYSGTVRTGGEVSAIFALKGHASAVLKVRTEVGAKGTYEGITMTPSRA